MTFWPRLAGETGATPEELTRANFVAREIFGSLPMREELQTYDNRLDAGCQTRMRVEMRDPGRAGVALAGQQPAAAARQPGHGRLLQRAGAAADGRAAVAADRPRAPRLRGPDVDGSSSEGVPEDLACRVAVLHPAYKLLGVVEIADRMSLDPVEVARLHFALGERLGLPDLVTRILALPRDDRWQTMARAALRDDVYAVHAQLTAQVLRDTDDSLTVPGPDPGVGGRRRRRRRTGGHDPRGDLRGRTRRPGPDVGRPPRRPRAARELIDRGGDGVRRTRGRSDARRRLSGGGVPRLRLRLDGGGGWFRGRTRVGMGT